MNRKLKINNQKWKGSGGYHEVLTIAIPLVLSTGTWGIQQFLDRVFLTWYSAEALAAAVPAGILNFTIMGLFLGTTTYVSTFVAQYFGAGRHDRIGPVLWQGIYIAIFSGLFHLMLIPLAGSFFQIVGHEPKVMELEIVYFQILCLGVGPMIGGIALSSFYSGRGRTWPIMWVNLASMCVNVLLNWILIFGKLGFPRLGIAGAGLGTVISGIFSLIVYLILICRNSFEETYRTKSGWRFDRQLFTRLMRFGLPNGIPFLLEHLCFAGFVLMIGRLGTIELAASNLTLNIEALGFLPMLGFGMAVSILVGQRIGEKSPDLAEKSVYSGFHLTFIYMFTVCLAYVSVPKAIFWLFMVNADPINLVPIRDLAVTLIKFVAIFSLFDTMYVIFSSAVRGAGDTKFTMYMVVIFSILALALPTYLALGPLNLGLFAAWTILTFYIGLLGFAFFIRFKGARWKSMRVIEPNVLNDQPIEI